MGVDHRSRPEIIDLVKEQAERATALTPNSLLIMSMDSALPEAETGQVIKELDRRHSVRSEREWIRHWQLR